MGWSSPSGWPAGGGRGRADGQPSGSGQDGSDRLAAADGKGAALGVM